MPPRRAAAAAALVAMSTAESRAYVQDYNDEDPDYRESSDEFDESKVPRSMSRIRAEWIGEHIDVLVDVKRAFLEAGRAQFGNAFFQLGDITSFANFCFKYTHPGAVTT